MTVLSSFLSLFSLSTLDTRLDPPQDEKKRTTIIQSAGPVRWYTKEFMFYAFMFILVVPQLFSTVMQASSSMYFY